MAGSHRCFFFLLSVLSKGALALLTVKPQWAAVRRGALVQPSSFSTLGLGSGDDGNDPLIRSSAATTNGVGNDANHELSDERKATLFQYMLRDLQVEGVPLLAVDVHQCDALQAALWTTLAELCDQPAAEKACMIFEDMEISVLKALVDDFVSWKEDDRLVAKLPELERISMSLLGKGVVGPAIVIQVSEARDAQDTRLATAEHNRSHLAEDRIVAALEAFFARWHDQFRQKGHLPARFRLCRQNDMPHILSSFWYAVCELRASSAAAAASDEALGSSVVMLPAIEDHEQFTAVSNILSRSLALVRCEDEMYNVAYYFPGYDRNKVHPVDEPVFGHIPPFSSIRSMFQSEEIDHHFSDREVELLNYERRAPVTAVAIRRVPSLHHEGSANDSKRDLQAEAGLGKETRAYADFIKVVAAQGKGALEAALARESALLHEGMPLS